MPKMDSGREGFAKGELDWLNGTFRVLPYRNFAINAATHRVLSHIPQANRGPASNPLTGKEVTAAGRVKANEAVCPNAAFDEAYTGIVIYRDTGEEATSRLVWFTTSGSGLPITPAGDNLKFQWKTTGIFRL